MSVTYEESKSRHIGSLYIEVDKCSELLLQLREVCGDNVRNVSAVLE